VGVTGLFSLGTGVNDHRGTVFQHYNIVETFSMIAGKHSLRMGGEAVQYQLNRYNNFAVRGSLTFGATSGTGNTFTALQNFLRGAPPHCNQPLVTARNFVATDYAAFIQDDYRRTSRMTINIWFALGSHELRSRQAQPSRHL